MSLLTLRFFVGPETEKSDTASLTSLEFKMNICLWKMESLFTILKSNADKARQQIVLEAHLLQTGEHQRLQQNWKALH